MSDLLTVLLITVLILIVVMSEVASAVLPLLIIVFLVPPHERADVAELIAAERKSRRSGLLAIVHQVIRVHRRRCASKRVEADTDRS